MDRAPNTLLAQHLHEAGWSDKGTARRVNLERGRRGRPSGYGGANVRGWRLGVLPDGLSRQVLSNLLSAELGRRVTDSDLGFPEAGGHVAGLTFSADLGDAVDQLTTLWRAEAQRCDGIAGTGYTPGGFAGPTRDWLLASPETSLGRLGSRRVGATEAAALWPMCEVFQGLDRRLGGGYARQNLLYLLNSLVAPLIRGRYTDAVGRQLLMVAARLTGIAGYTAYDSGQQGLAQRYYIQALRLARAAGEDALAAHIFGDMSRQAYLMGEMDEAEALARAGQQAATTSPADLARCACLQARALARRGDRQASRRAMARAATAMEPVATAMEPVATALEPAATVPATQRVEPPVRATGPTTTGMDPASHDHGRTGIPSWIRYFTPDQLEAEFAHVAEVLGRPAEVLRLAATPLRIERPLERRHALLLAAVARAHLASGEPDQALSAADQLACLAENLASQRVAEAASAVDGQLRAHVNPALIAEREERAVAAQLGLPR